MTRTVHLCLSVRGAIANHRPHELAKWIKHDDGRQATPQEALDYLLDELAQGHEVIPVGEPCEGFDYSGGGCPGHETP